MKRLDSSHVCSTIMPTTITRWLAIAIVSLFTHTATAQNHLDLAAIISGGNTTLSNAVYGLQTTAYFNGSSLQIAGEGSATALDVNASNFSSVNFSDTGLNSVNTVIIRFENASNAASTINAGLMSALENLSNVVLLFAYDVSTAEASSFAIGSIPNGATSYYSVSIPE
jgi:hypothetical protein